MQSHQHTDSIKDTKASAEGKLQSTRSVQVPCCRFLLSASAASGTQGGAQSVRQELEKLQQMRYQFAKDLDRFESHVEGTLRTSRAVVESRAKAAGIIDSKVLANSSRAAKARHWRQCLSLCLRVVMALQTQEPFRAPQLPIMALYLLGKPLPASSKPIPN